MSEQSVVGKMRRIAVLLNGGSVPELGLELDACATFVESLILTATVIAHKAPASLELDQMQDALERCGRIE
jgi:hypothetical protein